MASARDGLARIKSSVTELLARLRVFIDKQAEKEKQAWGSSMEYKRRYTNPDDAKRARTPPDQKN
jgi:hypothetical protein